MDHDRYPDAYIRSVLDRARTIAVVGASPKPERPSHVVMKYLLAKGYRVIPVNPGHEGRDFLGQRVYGSLSEIPSPIDMVDIFRQSDAAARVVDEALALDPRPGIIWMQIGVRHDEAAARAEAAGIDVVMDRCPKIELDRLSRATPSPLQD